PQTEYAITRREARDGAADRLDLARELAAENPRPRSKPTEIGPPEQRPGSAHVAIGLGHRGRAHLHEKLVVARNRALHVLETKDLGRAVAIVDDCPHGCAPVSVSTTLPTFCWVST